MNGLVGAYVGGYAEGRDPHYPLARSGGLLVRLLGPAQQLPTCSLLFKMILSRLDVLAITHRRRILIGVGNKSCLRALAITHSIVQVSDSRSPPTSKLPNSRIGCWRPPSFVLVCFDQSTPHPSHSSPCALLGDCMLRCGRFGPVGTAGVRTV